MRIPEDLLGREQELELIELFDTTEPFVDVTQACPDVLVRLYQSKNVLRQDPRALVRLGIALMLNSVARKLPPGIRLMVRDAWRAPKTQAGIHENQADQIERMGLAQTREEARKKADQFAVPAEEPYPPPHTTGGAVDVTLAYAKTEQLLPMRKAFRRCTPQEWQNQKYRDYKELPAYIVRSRKLLREAMELFGFASIPNEWWHFSYGDFWWAARRNKKRTLYLSVHKPHVMEKNFNSAYGNGGVVLPVPDKSDSMTAMKKTKMRGSIMPTIKPHMDHLRCTRLKCSTLSQCFARHAHSLPLTPNIIHIIHPTNGIKISKLIHTLWKTPQIHVSKTGPHPHPETPGGITESLPIPEVFPPTSWTGDVSADIAGAPGDGACATCANASSINACCHPTFNRLTAKASFLMPLARPSFTYPKSCSFIYCYYSIILLLQYEA